jgi:transposase InsO family protein
MSRRKLVMGGGQEQVAVVDRVTEPDTACPERHRYGMPNGQRRAELAAAIFEWIECWYNPLRRHSSIGMLSPVDYEAVHASSDPDH